MPRHARLDAPGTLHHVMVREIERRQRTRRLSAARHLLCQRPVRHLGYSGAAVARFLGGVWDTGRCVLEIRRLGGRAGITDIFILASRTPGGITVVQNSYDVNSRDCQQVHADSGTYTFLYITADRATLSESFQILAEAAAGGPISQTPCTGGPPPPS